MSFFPYTLHNKPLALYEEKPKSLDPPFFNVLLYKQGKKKEHQINEFDSNRTNSLIYVV